MVANQLLDIISKLISATTSYASRASPMTAAPTVRASSAAQLANLTSSCTHCGCNSVMPLCDALITENHRRRIQRYIPSTDHYQAYPSRRQGHATAEFRERLADVSLAVLRDRSHHRRHSVVPRVSLPDALVFSLRIRTGGPRAAHHRGTCSGCPPRLVFATLQDRVVLDLGRLALARCEVPLHFFNLDIWATESKTPSFKLVWPRPHRFAELLELCVTGSHNRAPEHLFKTLRHLGKVENFECRQAPSCSKRLKVLAKHLDLNFSDGLWDDPI